MMSAIRGKNSQPEVLVRRYLFANGLRFRLHARNLPGRPDIVLARFNTVVFVHGCFWHRHPGCRYATTPQSRTDFWKQKFAANVARDARQIAELETLGWNVLVIWECETSSAARLQQLVDHIRAQD
jgi:DNA mismatch endonuclease, patch repair protein